MSISLRAPSSDRELVNDPWGSETRIRSCGEAVVLVDESAEQVPAANIARADLDRLCGRCD